MTETIIPFLYKADSAQHVNPFMLNTFNVGITLCRRLGWEVFEFQVGKEEADSLPFWHFSGGQVIEEDGFFKLKTFELRWDKPYLPNGMPDADEKVTDIWFSHFKVRRIDEPSALKMRCKPWTEKDQTAWFEKITKSATKT